MTATLSQSYLAQVEAVRQRTREHVLSGRAIHASGRVDRDLVALLASAGFLSQLFPETYGGSAPGTPSARTLCAVREGIASESVAAETAFALQGLGSYPILVSGSDSVKSRWLPQVAQGCAVAAFALTEPEAGSDAASLTTQAIRVDGGFLLSGTKKWISNAPDADIYSVFARTSDGGGRGITAFAVAGDAAGLRGEPLRIIGGHAIGQLTFDDVFVPATAVLGEVNHGLRVALQTLTRFRPSVGAGAVGMAQAALEYASAYARSRRAFGATIGSFQAVSHLLADMDTRVTAARLLVIEAALASDEHQDDLIAAAARAKLFATESAQFVVDAAIQIVGAAALEESHLLAALYAEVRALRIYEGTSEIQRNIIARPLLNS